MGERDMPRIGAICGTPAFDGEFQFVGTTDGRLVLFGLNWASPRYLSALEALPATPAIVLIRGTWRLHSTNNAVAAARQQQAADEVAVRRNLRLMQW